MALRRTVIESEDQWKSFFSEQLCFRNKEIVASYAKKFCEDGYCDQSIRLLLENTPPGKPSPDLLALGIKPGHCLKMAGYFVPSQSVSVANNSVSGSKLKIPRPVLNLDATQVEFDQFCFEWKTYRSHYNIQPFELPSHLFYCGSEEVRKRIRIENPSFTTSTELTEAELIDTLKSIVLSRVSKIVHIKQFYSLVQNPGESCNNYLSKLQSKASCCGFSCLSCGKEASNQRVKEQFIIGLTHKTIQVALLKTESVSPGTPLESLLAEALTLEHLWKVCWPKH